MSDEKKKEEAPKAEKKGGSGLSIVTILAMVVTAAIAGGAAFFGARFASAHHTAEKEVVVVEKPHPPGPTMTLDPFLITVMDSTRKAHAMKVTIALEFGKTGSGGGHGGGGGEEEMKALIPRVRDTVLTFLRSLSFDDAEKGFDEKSRDELQKRLHHVGADVQQVLITDFVLQ